MPSISRELGQILVEPLPVREDESVWRAFAMRAVP
jgi:hypothetical protein